MSTPYVSDPFDISAVLALHPLQDDSKSTLIWQGFHLDSRLENETFSLADVNEERLPKLEIGLFELKFDEDTALTPVDPSSVSDYATADEGSQDKRLSEPETTRGDIEDVWILPEVWFPAKTPILTSWDRFLKDQHEEPPPACLSEAKPNVFDAVIQVTCKFPLKRVKPGDFLNALYELGLGRNSAVFVWDEQTSTFKQNLEAFTVTGFTPGTIQAVVEEFKTGAELFRLVQRHRPHASGRADIIAFHAVLRSCLLSIEAYMELQKTNISSVLSLRRVFEGPLSLLQICKQLSNIFQGSQTAVVQLQSLFNQCLTCSVQHPRFRPFINHVLAAVSAPTLRQLGAALGLGLTRRYSNVETETLLQNVFTQSTLLQVAKETYESLGILGKASPERLVAMAVPESGELLRLSFTWIELNSLQQEASRYEMEARSRMQRTGKDEALRPCLCYAGETMPKRLHTDPNDEEGDMHVLPCLDTLSSELLTRDDAQNVALYCLTNTDNTGSVLTVPLSEVLDLSLSPFLFAQHRLVSYSVLNALFSTHRFSLHLYLLRQIHLFGDGMFTARLSMALFGDDELGSSGEGDRSTTSQSITSGLRLQTRDSWPPASSELRLVLMGILSDSVQSAVGPGIVRELEDTSSFAIRDLSDDELDACRDINSIHALDFLKLQYKPSNPLLEAVVTTDSLSKYDRIFKHLLRVLRLKSHFMATLADYCANVAIALPWARLQQAVKGIESRLGKDDYDGTLHASTLDEMLRALLLRKQSEAAAEAEAMRALETLFNLVLDNEFPGGHVSQTTTVVSLALDAALLELQLVKPSTSAEFHLGDHVACLALGQVVWGQGFDVDVDAGGADMAQFVEKGQLA
ncbi:hypothetical protein DV736_g6145, partial [Chaetothyriales sp. CBS 134916]